MFPIPLLKRRSNLLCAIIKKPTPEKIAYANQAADLIELRVDLFEKKDLEALKTYRNLCKLPVIFTLKEDPRDFLNLKPDFIDLDYKMPLHMFQRAKGVKIIASQHEGVRDRLFSVPADIYKAAIPARSIIDALKMVLEARKEKRCFIGLCTGHFGEITRILSPFSYAPVSLEDQTAEGQILLRDLQGIYRYREINKKTAFYGLVGDPVTQSPSHIVHNFAFEKLGVNARYIKMEVKSHELETFFYLAPKIFQGLSVTIPHKQEVKKYIRSDHIAINTVTRGVGFNTDGRAALDLIESKKKCQKMVILGNGGVALGIAEEASKRGLEVICLYRTHKTIPFKTLSLDSFLEHDYDVLVNATSADDIIETFLPNRVVLDVNLRHSLFLDRAREKNCDVIEGRDLFFKQAAYQYEHWFHSTSF